MTIPKIIRTTSLFVLMAIALPATAVAIVPETATVKDPAKTENVRVQQLTQRLEEIRNIDKSELTRMEKKNLRKEVREMKKEMKALSGGVYLSVGAIIIVILLLILLL
jgi:predicted PurR-regulated permease PerM